MEGKGGGRKTREAARALTQAGGKGTWLGAVEVMRGGLVAGIFLKVESIGFPDRLDVEGDGKRRVGVIPRMLFKASENGITCRRGRLREARDGEG